jgi:hypothetical protein
MHGGFHLLTQYLGKTTWCLSIFQMFSYDTIPSKLGNSNSAFIEHELSGLGGNRPRATPKMTVSATEEYETIHSIT